MKWELLRQGGDVPVARSSHTVSQIGPKLFLFGGEHDPRTPINSDVHAYDVASGDWSVLRASGPQAPPQSPASPTAPQWRTTPRASMCLAAAAARRWATAPLMTCMC